MRHAITISLLSLCAFTGQSRADALDIPSSSDPKTAPAAGDSLVLGLGVAYVPEYTGADKNRAVPLPLLERTFDNGAFISTMRGVGFQTDVQGFNLSAALNYGGARKERRSTFSGSDALKGMGDIDGSAQVLLGLGYKLGASMPLYTSASDQIGFSTSAVYGDNKHAQTYFGVTAAQSARSGYKAYTAKGGFETAEAAVNWNHVIDKTWSVHTVVGVTHLLSDAADSPLTKRKTTPMIMTGFSYKF